MKSNDFKSSLTLFILSLILVFVSSCKNDELLSESRQFNYATYNAYKSMNLNVPLSKAKGSSTSRTTQDLVSYYEDVIVDVNNYFDSQLTLTSLDYDYINNIALDQSTAEVELSYLNNTDEMLINQFNTDIIQYGFENAKYNLQNTILSLNLSDEQFNKYNNFINILMLLNNYDPNILIEGLNAGSITGRNAACGESIAAYSLATIGLAGCVVTGPFAPIVCGAAIASKVLAFRAMLRDCR